MKPPLVTVLMSVYNAALYLPEAIESILGQTFTDFEFLIINDGSTDNSLEIIKSYAKNDSRINLISRENKGLIESLNEGIELSRGDYISRMDADDVAHTQRLQKQINYLENNKDISVCASRVRVIDKNGNELPDWVNDATALTSLQIRERLVRTNCVAHPSTTIRKVALEKYKYKQNQKNIEDYDLWLRMCRDGLRIHKLAEKLLDYRSHQESLTGGSEIDFQKNLINARVKYLLNHMGWNKYDLRIFYILCLDIAFYYKISAPYIYLKRLLKIPTAYLSYRKAYKQIKASNEKECIALIVPVLNSGGAERMSLLVFKALSEQYNIIVLTTEENSADEWEHKFREISSLIIKLGELKFLTFKERLLRKIVSKIKPVSIFTTTSYAAYPLLEFAKNMEPLIKVINIIHGEGGKFENFGVLPYVKQYDRYIDLNIVVTDRLQNILKNKYGIPQRKIKVIKNCVELTDSRKAKTKDIWGQKKLKIIWVGRLASEKHPEKVIDIASELIAAGLSNFSIEILGSGYLLEEMRQLISEMGLDEKINIRGLQNDVDLWLKKSHILLMTSETESLPLIALEAMRNSRPIISSNVGGMKEVVNNRFGNGVLIDFDKRFAKETARIILKYDANRQILKDMGENGRSALEKYFNIKTAIDEYRKVAEG